MASYAVATDLLALLHACGEKSTPLTAIGGGLGLRDRSGISTGTVAVEAMRSQWANKPAAFVGLRPRMVDVPGPPPRGAPV